jgi:endonuclease G, mitochondrial
MPTTPDFPLDASNNELRAALAEFKAAAKRPYYDEESDRKSQDSYYADVPTDADAADLYQELQQLVTNTHKSKLSYQPSRHVYPWVDLRPNLKIQSIYSTLEFEPEKLIEEDFRTQTLRTMHSQTLQLKPMSAEQLRHRVDLLEASLPFNCEHVVPQSWFGKKEPMRGDLHHLFACESGCNSFRGNHPYFDFPDLNKAVRSSCGRLEGGKFEPGHGKGPVARAVLYFLLRYPGEINKTEKEYKADRIPTLLDWHQADPVDEYELHRNAAIFEKQGNRNPLIDHPEWAEQIDFRAGLG